MNEQDEKDTVSPVDKQRGDLATKVDVERLAAGLELLRTESRKDIDYLREGQKRLEEGQKEQRKGNRWAIGIAVSGFALLGTLISSQISDMRDDIRELRQSQQNEKQAERTGNSARPAQEGRISAADHSGS